jgi:hypothetical protein
VRAMVTDYGERRPVLFSNEYMDPSIFSTTAAQFIGNQDLRWLYDACILYFSLPSLDAKITVPFGNLKIDGPNMVLFRNYDVLFRCLAVCFLEILQKKRLIPAQSLVFMDGLQKAHEHWMIYPNYKKIFLRLH